MRMAVTRPCRHIEFHSRVGCEAETLRSKRVATTLPEASAVVHGRMTAVAPAAAAVIRTSRLDRMPILLCVPGPAHLVGHVGTRRDLPGNRANHNASSHQAVCPPVEPVPRRLKYQVPYRACT